MEALPRYDDLPMIPELGMRHAWDVFGRDDRVGTMNLLSPDAVVEASRLVELGEVFSLDLPLDEPDPPLFGRQAYRRSVVAVSRNDLDDRLDGFHPQASTQWDALGHVRAREVGYWGGRTTDPTTEANDLGIDQWATRGIVGRGVLVDVAGWAADAGERRNPLAPYEITAADLHAVLAHQGVELRRGDILCVRTGWTSAYRLLDRAERARYARAPRFAGLRGDDDVARFVWDAHVAALCCDNPAVEVTPGDPAVGSLHRRLIPLLGVALGELFDLDALATRCRQLDRWTFLFASAPLHVPGGLGSPGNSLGIL